MPIISASELIESEKQDNFRMYGQRVCNIGMAEYVVAELLPILDGMTDMLSPQTQMWLQEHDKEQQEPESPQVDNERHSTPISSDDEQGSLQPVEGESGRTGLFAHHRVLVGDT